MRVRSHLEGETTRESRAMVSASQEQITAIASVSWQRRVADATAFLLCLDLHLSLSTNVESAFSAHSMTISC